MFSLLKRLKGSTLPIADATEPTDRDEWQSSTGIRDIDGLWQEALDGYRRSLPSDLCDLSTCVMLDLERCLTTEDIMDVVQDASESLGNALRLPLVPVTRNLYGRMEAELEKLS